MQSYTLHYFSSSGRSYQLSVKISTTERIDDTVNSTSISTESNSTVVKNNNTLSIKHLQTIIRTHIKDSISIKIRHTINLLAIVNIKTTIDTEHSIE